MSVSGTNASNPFASLQSLWQQASSATGAQAQSNPLSALLAALGQQSGGGASSTSGAASTGGAASPSGTTAASGNASSQFGPQTLQALLALQTNGGNQQSLASQFENAASGTDPLSELQTQQSQGQNHHHHHHMGGQTGAGGSATTDTASSGSPSGTSSSSAGGASGTGNNLLEQLLQMQAQLVTPAPTQSIATA